MKILLLSRWFFPAKSPRAFRTTELLRELTKRGYEVDFFCPEEAVFDCDFATDKLHVYRIPMSQLLKQKTMPLNARKNQTWQTVCVNIVRRVSYYFLGGGPRDVIYAVRLYRELEKRVSIQTYDLLFAISYPFCLLVASALYSLHNKQIRCKIADCGDPLYYNPGIIKAPYLKYIEKIILQKFDWITIPMREAMVGYRHCDLGERLRIVPQGFKLMNMEDDIYCPNMIPHFCYAGVFYEKIRDPSFFFDFLCKLQEPFYFIIYALEDSFTNRVLLSYRKKLGEKLLIRAPVEREQLIHEMATMDFVINFDNENSNQRPSKLIDYAMSRRPILSFNRQTFRSEDFQAFLQGDYSAQYRVDLEQYDIRRVVDQFEALFEKKAGEEVQ